MPPLYLDALKGPKKIGAETALAFSSMAAQRFFLSHLVQLVVLELVGMDLSL